MIHKTNSKIYVPNYEKLLACVGKNHANGALGLWYMKHEDVRMDGFGKNVYSFGIRNPKPLRVNISDHASTANMSKETFINMRKAYLKQGFTHIEIIETDGRCDMGVLLDFDAIAQWKYIK